MVFKPRTFYGETPEGEQPKNPLAGLENRVSDVLATVHGLDASDVEVTAENGAIMLTGYVSQPEEIDRAGEAAQSVDGVTHVENRISLPPEA